MMETPNITAPALAPATATPQTFRQRLDAGEQHWLWKFGLRAFVIVVGIIGIGCIAWATATAASTAGHYEYDLDDRWFIIWSLITFSVSVIWCSVCILVLLLRRPNKPCHPGVAVGVDLVIWLALVPTAMFALLGAMSVLQWGEDGYISRYSSYGYYYHAPNGTWVWNATEYDSYHGRSRDCSNDGQYSGYSGNYFSSCDEEDAFVNHLWQSRNRRAGVEVAGVVCQFISLLCHIALFTWACVDTHMRNKKKVSKEAEKIAANIVMEMVRGGAIVQAPGASYQQQTWGPHKTFAPSPVADHTEMMVPQQAAMGHGEKSARFA